MTVTGTAIIQIWKNFWRWKPSIDDTPKQLTGMKKDIALAILGDFNPLNLRQEDVQKIAEQFQSARIYPSAELATILSDNGFNSRAVGELLGTVGLSGEAIQGEISSEVSQKNIKEEESSFAFLLESMMNKNEDEKKTRSFY